MRISDWSADVCSSDLSHPLNEEMTVFKALDEKTLVAGQIAPADLAAAKALGVTTVINNRPDGEAPDKPRGSEIAEAAQAAGLGCVAIPVTSGFSMEQVAIGRASGRERVGQNVRASGG